MSSSNNARRRERRPAVNLRLFWCILVALVSFEARVASASTDYSPSTRSVPSLVADQNKHNDDSNKSVKQVSNRLKNSQVGFFYGIRHDLLKSPPRAPRLSEIMTATLDELREARSEIDMLRQEILVVKRQQQQEELANIERMVDNPKGRRQRRLLARRK